MKRRGRRYSSTILVLVIITTVALLTAGTTAQSQTPLTRAELKSQLRLVVIGVPGSGDGAFRVAGSPSARSGDDEDDESGLGPNVQVSKNQSSGDALRTGASETTIAAAAGGRNLVAGWNDGEGFAFAPFQPGPPLGLSGYGFSADGGQTWTDGGAPPTGTEVGFSPGPSGRSATGVYVTRGDPWLDVNDEGAFFYTNLAVWEDDATDPPAGISVHRGRFRGRRFGWTDSVLLQSPNYPRDFLDKEALAVSGQHVYVTVTNFIEVCNEPFFGFGQIELYRSLSGGTTWSRTIIQPDETVITNPAEPDCGAEGIIDQGSAPAIGPSGQLYVTWERGWLSPLFGGSLPRATIAFRKSLNHGASFGPLRTVRSICSGALSPPAGYNRTSSNDFPRIAVAQRGFFSGRIYIAYQDCSAREGTAPFGQDTDVYIVSSDDEGATWSAPEPLHRTADGKIQFWPVVSVDSEGEVTVVYYESREVNVTPPIDDDECVVRTGGPLDNPTLKRRQVSSLVDVMLVRSRNGGQSFSHPVRVTTRTTNWCRATPINSIIPNFGDYIDLRSIGTRTLVTWADGRNRGRRDHIPTVFFSSGR